MFSDFQKKKIAYFFRLLDLNRNGLLQFNDFSDMAEQVRLKLNFEEGSKDHKKIADKATRLFHRFLEDINPKEHQSISEEEWVSFFESKLGANDEDLIEEYQELIFQYVFDFFDHNHDGFITKDEYQMFFEIFGANPEYFDKSFTLLDKNGDGKISRYEMLASIEDFLVSDNPSSSGNWTFGNWESNPS